MQPSPEQIRKQIAIIRAGRPALQRRAERVLLNHYREHRKLPRSPLLSLVGSRALYRIVARGEIEHAVGFAWLSRQVSRLRDRFQRKP
jgi:hypothetical protein